jgi:8-oxo-dGTP diphosphatase
VTAFLVRFFYFPVVLVLVLNLIQRRHMARGVKKRFATLYQAILLLAYWGITYLFQIYRVRDIWLLAPTLAAAGLVLFLRGKFLPFRLRCVSCGARLPLRTVLFDDANRCEACSPPERSRAEDAGGEETESHGPA